MPFIWIIFKLKLSPDSYSNVNYISKTFYLKFTVEIKRKLRIKNTKNEKISCLKII